MASSTNKVEIKATEYTNVSGGNDNCALMVRFNQKLRVCAGDYGVEGPPMGDEEYFSVTGGAEEYSGARYVLSFNNLNANPEDSVWVRSESGPDSVIVVRGEILIGGRK